MKFPKTIKFFVFLFAAEYSSAEFQSEEKKDVQAELDLDQLQLKKMEHHRGLFTEWKRTFSKEYESLLEEVERMDVWIKNHELINAHNSKVPRPSYTLGHNQFSDLTAEEFRELNNLAEFSPGVDVIVKHQEKAKAKAMDKAMDKLMTEDEREIRADYRKLVDVAKNDELPESVDWVSEGAVTAVKNQGPCGGCWAFSATGAIEGAMFLKTHELVSLSEQNLLDCDNVDKACEGGLMETAFQFDEAAKGLCSEDDYPYLAQQAICNTECMKVVGSVVKDYIDLAPGDSDGLLASIALQPTAVALQADQLVFQFYDSGVLDDETCGEEGMIDHGVLAVGYGTDEETGLDYYKIKNSWGDAWGEDGYIRMMRSTRNPYGMCAILRLMTVPIME